MNVYKEKQRMTQWWVWLILFGVVALWVWGIIQQIILGVPFGSKPVSDLELLVSSVLPVGILLFIYFLRLNTVYDQEGIEVNYFPLISKKVKWSDIKSAEILEYGFVGYGLRFSLRYGTVYNAKGNKGILLKLKNGRKILIGTQDQEKVRRVIQEYLN